MTTGSDVLMLQMWISTFFSEHGGCTTQQRTGNGVPPLSWIGHLDWNGMTYACTSWLFYTNVQSHMIVVK